MRQATPGAPGPRLTGRSPAPPRWCKLAATGDQRRAGGEHASPPPAPTPPAEPPPSSSRPPPGRARSAAAARMRRAKQPTVVTPPTAVQPPPPPTVLPGDDDDDDDDPSLYSIEPEVLPIRPADLAAALEGISSGDGAGIGIFSGGGGGEGGGGGAWEGPPALGDPALLVQAESSLVAPSTRPGDAGDAALAPAPGGREPAPAVASELDPDALVADLTQEERDERTDLIVSLATAGAGFEDALSRTGPTLDAACLALLERRIRALKLTATSPTDKAGLHTLNLLLARLTAEVARRAATPVERALDVALRLLARPPGEVAGVMAREGFPPASPPNSGSSSSFDPAAAARIAATRSFLRTVVDRGPGRGRGGPDLLAAEVAAALAARAAGGGGEGAPADPSSLPDLPPVWEESPLPAAALVAEAGVLVEAVKSQVAELRAATKRFSAPALFDKLEEREGLLGEVEVLAGLCRELAG